MKKLHIEPLGGRTFAVSYNTRSPAPEVMRDPARMAKFLNASVATVVSRIPADAFDLAGERIYQLSAWRITRTGLRIVASVAILPEHP